VRREFRVDGSRVATGLTFGVMGGAIGGCIAACQGSSALRRDLACGGVAVVGAMALFVVLVMLGGHDGGRRACSAPGQVRRDRRLRYPPTVRRSVESTISPRSSPLSQITPVPRLISL